MRNAFIDTILKSCAARKDVFMISGDAGLGVFDAFKESSSDRFVNLGVAEQNAASFAAGMALGGYKVYLYNIIPFVLYRCYEQVRNDICYQKQPVVLVGIGSGVTYAPQGMTHYSVEDLGIALTLPNLTVFSPIDPIEARLAAKYSLDAKTPVYVRLAKRGEPDIHKEREFDITLPRVIEDGERVAILFHGSIAGEAVEAGRMLADSGIRPKLISIPMVQPLNFEAIDAAVANAEFVVTVEEHFTGSGLGARLACEWMKRRPRWQLSSLGIPDAFIHKIKDTANMRESFGISAGRIAKFVKNLLKDRKAK